MTLSGTPPREPRRARLDRAVDALTQGNERWQALRQAFPGLIKVFLITGLAILSWLATYVGMLELIAANTGPVDLHYRIAIGFSVAMLMAMIIYLLDALFSPIGWGLRTLYIFGYIFLTLISVGFGFGFYWKFLESRAEATRSAETAIGHVQSSLQQTQVQLDQLQATLDTLTVLSREKAVQEREQGNSCPDSQPGDGPRRRLRHADAQEFAFISTFIGSRSQAVKNDFDALTLDMGKVISNDPSTYENGTRNRFMRSLNRTLDLTLARFNALRTDPQLAEHRDRLAKRASRKTFPDGSGGVFACPDAQLQSALNGVVKAIDGLPEIEKPEILAVEGPEATVEAFRRLTVTMIGALRFELPPGPEELRALQHKAVQSARDGDARQASVMTQSPGLGPRDYIPLFVAIFVDFCILLVSVNRPINRFQMLVTLAREAREGPVAEILGRFHKSHTGGLAREFEVFQHVVFDFIGDYYVAVPISARSIEARYLANLFVSLEGKGIVDRVMLPPDFVVRRKLARQNSEFARETAFRLYRFRDGAWSKMVLDAILGGDLPEMPSTDAAQAKGAGLNGAGANGPGLNGETHGEPRDDAQTRDTDMPANDPQRSAFDVAAGKSLPALPRPAPARPAPPRPANGGGKDSPGQG